MVGSVLHYILDLKHVSCTSALLGYTVSILSFIGNSLVPKSEHLCFYCYAKAFFGVCVLVIVKIW